MEYSEIIYLIDSVLQKDTIGNVVSSSETQKEIFAKMQSVRTNEFYNATMNGLSPSAEFVIKRLNYSGESMLKWNNEIYEVIRTVDPKNKYDIVLVCAKKIGKKPISEYYSCLLYYKDIKIKIMK